MSIYGLIPLIATVAYIPVLIIMIGARPWRYQQRLFTIFLVAAIIWSLTDFIFRNHFFPDQSFLILRIIMAVFITMLVLLHVFTSSFFPQGKGRWLTFAYAGLAVMLVLNIIGFVPRGVTAEGQKLFPDYGSGIYLMLAFALVMLARNLYVFTLMLKNQSNPIIYNQIISLRMSLLVLAFFSIVAILPVARETPVSHIGNIIVAFILSYAVIGQRLVDINVALRRGLVWFTMVVMGVVTYAIVLTLIHIFIGAAVDFIQIFITGFTALVTVFLVYRMRNFFITTMSKALEGITYDYRHELFAFANQIQNIFSLQDQGGKLLKLITQALGSKQAGLLFLDSECEYYYAHLTEPLKDNTLADFKLRTDNPIIDYLKKNRKPLNKESLNVLPEFKGLWEKEKDEIKQVGVDLFMPLISRENLIGILVLTKKHSGMYTLEDLRLMEDIANRVAVSMEKEYLREQLNEKEKELSIINRSSAIITSTFDIQRIYDSFVAGLKEVVNVDWAAICIIEDNEIYFMAISSSIGSPWKVGERIPLKGTATEHVAKNRTPWIATDLALESPFTTGKYLLQHGLHSVAYLPLKAGSRITGSLAIGSHLVNGYNQRKVKLLEQLASQVAMPIENARLYAETAKMARNDELTGLLNRRSLNEILVSEVVRHSRYGGVFSLMVLDIDRFKSFNDTYGHLAGDKILREVGAVMKNTIREADQAFRYGGDEFAILLPQTSAEAASIVAERVRQEITSRAKIDNISVTISLGMASWPADGISPNDVIAAADSALYQAKHAGGNQSIVSSSLLDLVSSTATIDTKDSEAMSTIFGLAASVDARDHYTRSHSKRVCEFAVAIAEAINMEPLAIDRLSNCALLHDIGKIGINDEILKKPDKFSDQEMKIVREHAKLGATMVSHVRQLSTCVHGIMHHHERWDGTGYPKGIKGEEIPLESRILAISDAFVAMTSDRIYSKALSYNEAIEEMKRYSGSQFDPKLLEVFLELLNKMPRESVIIREG